MTPEQSKKLQRAKQLLAQNPNQRDAARQVGMSESTLRYHLKKEKLAVPRPPAAQVPPAPPAEHAPPAAPALTFVAVPELQEMLELLRDLNTRVEGLEHARVAPALPAAPAAPAISAPPAAERKDVMQWTVRMSRALIEHIKAVAYDRRLNPSELVEQWLWAKAQEYGRPEVR